MPLNLDGISVSLGTDLAGFDKGFDAAINRIQSFGADATRAADAAGDSFNGLAAGTTAAAGRYVDAAGKMREANGRFVSSATLAAEAAGNFGGAAANASNGFAKFSRAGEELKGLGQTLSVGVTLPIIAAGAAALKSAGDMQALEKGFAATYKGAEPLADALAKVQELAKLPGLGLKEALQGATNLQAAGFSADLARRSLGAFGNALATVGRGKDDLNGVQLALGQIASKGKISAEEINQLAERVPQIRAAMQAAFGTADTEQLQKMKIGATEFVEGVTRELEKLPKVTGGINNAFENLGDSFSKATAKIGSRINTLFDVEGAIGRVGDFIDGLIVKFEALPDSVQRAAFGFAAAAAAIGPLLAGIGALGTAIPALVAGFGTVGAAVGLAAGPLALVVAGVAAAAVAIISNWDEISAYFTTGRGGKVFGDLADSVVRSVGVISAAFGQLTGYKEDFGDLVSLGGLIAGVFEELATEITAFADTVSSVVGFVTKLFALDFTGALNDLGNAAEALTRPLRSLLGLTRVEPQSISSFFDMAGAIRAADDAAGAAALSGGNLGAVLGQAASKSAALTDEQTKALEKFQQAIRTNETLARALGSSYDFVGERQKIFEQGLKSLADVGFTAAQLGSRGFSQELALLNGLLTDTDRLTGRTVEGLAKLVKPKTNPLDGSQLDKNANRLPTNLQPLPGYDTTELGASVDAALANYGRLTTGQQAAFQATLDLNTQTEQLFDSLPTRIGTALASAAAVVADNLGQIIAGTSSFGGGMEAAFRGVLGIVADFASQFGQQMVALGIAKTLVDKFGVTPGPAMIAAGLGLIAAAGIAKAFASKGPKLSSGGIGSAGSAVSSPRSSVSSTSSSTVAQPTVQNNTLTVQVVARGRDLMGVVELQRDSLGRIIGQP